MLPKLTKEIVEHPKKLFLFSTAKTGKTTLLSGLPNCLIIDTEDGSDFIPGIKYNLKKESLKTNTHPAKLLRLLSEEIKEANIKKKDFVYDFIAFDTVTELESIAYEVATVMYKQALVGKKYEGTDVVADLPKGGGYLWLRKAFKLLHGYFEGLARYSIIFVGHVKNSSIIKLGTELSAIDIDLVGKNKSIMCQECDAVGIIRRMKGDANKVECSFKTFDRDLVTGARPTYLRDKEFVISELNDKGKFEFHWDVIYPQLKEK